jgi:HNH endonuclease
MPFPQSVREDALMACARRCCLCHRLKHTKMECHHIVPEADGGENTFDNCIPLCLDCHGEVCAYNPRHSVGTQYGVKELKRRRDDWYAKIKASPSIQRDERHVEIDRHLFARLRERLPSTRAKHLFHDLDYGTPFPRMLLDLLYSLEDFGHEPESEFLDATLESLFAEFRFRVHELRSNRGFERVVTCLPNPDLYQIPKTYQDAYSDYDSRFEEYSKITTGLNEAARELYKAYVTLVRESRRQLMLD